MLIRPLARALRAADIRWVRVLWCDNANVIRHKAFNLDLLDSRFVDGVGISEAQMAIPVMYDAVVQDAGLTPVGEVRLRPDWNTLAILPFAPGHCQSVGDMVSAGEDWPACPRRFLRRQLARAAERGLEICAAFENEFFLLHADPEAVTPIDYSAFATTGAANQSAEIIDDMTEALQSQDIQVEQIHPEAGPGQFELATRYAFGLEAADRQIAVRETVRGVAQSHGLRASFLPKPFEHAAGSGCHIHISLWRDGRNITADPEAEHGISGEGKAFMAGLLDHLPALMAISTPSTNSYRRIQPHFWSGAFRAWGFDNREAAVRVPRAPDGGPPSNIEFKVCDASANPYLALGALIAAGLDGMDRGLEPGAPVAVDPGTMSDADRQATGIDPLPRSLGEALEHLTADKVLTGAMEPMLARSFLAVRRAEWEALREATFDEEVRLLADRY